MTVTISNPAAIKAFFLGVWVCIFIWALVRDIRRRRRERHRKIKVDFGASMDGWRKGMQEVEDMLRSFNSETEPKPSPTPYVSPSTGPYRPPIAADPAYVEELEHVAILAGQLAWAITHQEEFGDATLAALTDFWRRTSDDLLSAIYDLPARLHPKVEEGKVDARKSQGRGEAVLSGRKEAMNEAVRAPVAEPMFQPQPDDPRERAKAPRGKLRLETAWLITCVQCGHTRVIMTCADPHPTADHGARQAAAKAANLFGWRFDRYGGWACPVCLEERPSANQE